MSDATPETPVEEDRSHLLKPWTLRLSEKDDSQFLAPITFDCQAENIEHAVEQAYSAYPECNIHWACKTPAFSNTSKLFQRYSHIAGASEN